MKVMAAVRRTIAALAICALLCACGGAFAAAKQSDIDAQIKQQEREFEKIQKQISQNQKKLTETAKREKSVANQLNKLSQRITVTQQRVNIVSLKMQKVKKTSSRSTPT